MLRCSSGNHLNCPRSAAYPVRSCSEAKYSADCRVTIRLKDVHKLSVALTNLSRRGFGRGLPRQPATDRIRENRSAHSETDGLCAVRAIPFPCMHTARTCENR